MSRSEYYKLTLYAGLINCLGAVGTQLCVSTADTIKVRLLRPAHYGGYSSAVEPIQQTLSELLVYYYMKEKLVELIKQNMSQRDIAAYLKISQTTVRYHLNKHGLKTTKAKYKETPKETKTENRKKKQREYTKERRYLFKTKALDYKGGKCQKCGYSRCREALEFHHIDPKEKDFMISHSNRRSWDAVKKELDKCVLLCTNCHNEEHSTTFPIKFCS